MTSATTSSSSWDAFNQPNTSNQSATGHSREYSLVVTSAEADASDLSTGAESEPESVVAWTAEETGINAENESTCTQSKTILNTLELNVELTKREWKCSAEGACEDELQSENDIGRYCSILK